MQSAFGDKEWKYLHTYVVVVAGYSQVQVNIELTKWLLFVYKDCVGMPPELKRDIRWLLGQCVVVKQYL